MNILELEIGILCLSVHRQEVLDELLIEKAIVDRAPVQSIAQWLERMGHQEIEALVLRNAAWLAAPRSLAQ